MSEPARKYDRLYTYGDYRTWPIDERWELIDGIAWNMSPAPNRFHQEIFGELFTQIKVFLKEKTCKVYAAPFDVLLPDRDDQAEDDVRTVVQPDISVICDRNKLTDKGCTGAPDWIIEILSPYTSKKDMLIKFDLYERHGVREYWIVDPGNRYVHVYVLENEEKYPEDPQVCLRDAEIPCTVLDGLIVMLQTVFAVE